MLAPPSDRASPETSAHIHAIGTAVPDHDVHGAFVGWAMSRLRTPRERRLFQRMESRCGIDHRWSVLPPGENGQSPVDAGGFYSGNRLPPTSQRMARYATEAPELALKAIAALGERTSLDDITHLVVASCTGFVAPGVDQIIAERLGLDPGVERTLVGFMGCYAAVAALRVADYIARAEPAPSSIVLGTQEMPQSNALGRHFLDAMRFRPRRATPAQRSPARRHVRARRRCSVPARRRRWRAAARRA